MRTPRARHPCVCVRPLKVHIDSVHVPVEVKRVQTCEKKSVNGCIPSFVSKLQSGALAMCLTSKCTATVDPGIFSFTTYSVPTKR